MTRLNNAVICLAGFFILFSYPAKGQDLYDAFHIRKYAAHLFSVKDYYGAATEYKRLALFYPDKDSIQRQVLVSYRLAGFPDSGINYVRKISTIRGIRDSYFFEELEKNLELSGRYREADSILHFTDSAVSLKYGFYNQALSGNWGIAREKFVNVSYLLKDHEQWKDLLQRQENLRYKSPALALAMSTIIPGSGKVYTGDWKDGLYSFLLVGTMAYESYVGFHARGTRSVLGWVFGGIAVGFYSGNIYGSYHAAKKYNIRLNKQIHQDAENLVISDF